jgi:general stress protein YciG
VAVPATLPKTVKEHQKQVVKVASIAGNFKNDPQRASEAGKKGGKNSHGSRES